MWAEQIRVSQLWQYWYFGMYNSLLGVVFAENHSWKHLRFNIIFPFPEQAMCIHSLPKLEYYDSMMKMERDENCISRAQTNLRQTFLVRTGNGGKKAAKVSSDISLTSLPHIFTLLLSVILFTYILWRVSLSTWVIFYFWEIFHILFYIEIVIFALTLPFIDQG